MSATPQKEMNTTADLDQLCINTIRALSIDAVQKAESGHPENVLTPGVEITTGPLGQGFANGVGMAMGAAHLSARFNKPEFPLMDHYIYAIVSDGDLMEGVASEAASLAGHLKLGKLIYLYDDNHVTIEGFTAL